MTAALKTDAMLGDLAVLAYHPEGEPSGDAPMPPGWEKINKEVHGSFAAFAYMNKETHEIVIAYRGTDDLGDWTGANKDILAGRWTKQMSMAVEFAAKVKDSADVIKLKDAKIYVTGHSLGGAEAQVVSQMFGFDGMTLDPLAAAKVVRTQEFRQYAEQLTQTEHGIGMPASFVNYGITDSFVSHHTGVQLGTRQPLPGMDLPKQELVKAALAAAAIHPAVGMASLLAADQIGSKHSSLPGAQAVRLLAEAEAQDVRSHGRLFAGQVKFEEVSAHRPGPLNRDIIEKQSGTVLMTGEDGEPRALLKFRGEVQGRVLEMLTPDGKHPLYRITDPHAAQVTPAVANELTEAQRMIVTARIQHNLELAKARGEQLPQIIHQEISRDADIPSRYS